MRIPKLYIDTSVVGGCYDAEFSVDSLRFFQNASQGKCIILISDVVITELEDAPEKIKKILFNHPQQYIEKTPLTEEVVDLRNEYLTAGILEIKWIDDLTHVAIATVSRADALVSWNFKHIVRLDKMKAYNNINILNGYGILTIVTPKEVFTDEN